MKGENEGATGATDPALLWLPFFLEIESVLLFFEVVHMMYVIQHGTVHIKISDSKSFFWRRRLVTPGLLYKKNRADTESQRRSSKVIDYVN